MSSYLVTRASDTRWCMNAGDLAQLLVDHWRILKMTHESDCRVALEWRMIIDNDDIDVRLFQPGTFFSLDADVGRAAIFAAWIRSLVPPDEDLLLMDEAANTVVRVRAGMTAQDVLARWAEDPPDDGGWGIEE